MGCSFCPQDKLGNAYHGIPLLSYEAFRNALLKLPKDVQIHFSGFSEPFLNPDCGRMIAHSLSEGFEVHIYTTLMGLSNRQMEALLTTRPKVIRLHVPDGKFLKIGNETWLRQLNLFQEWGRHFTAMAMGPIDTELARILSDRGIKVELPDMLSRGGNLWQSRRIEGKLRCTMNRWNQNVMLPNGDVVLCCMDYSLSHKLGNMFSDDYDHIISIGDILRKMAEANKAPEICRSCEWAQAL